MRALFYEHRSCQSENVLQSISAMSRKRKALSFKDKLEILKKVDEEPKKRRIDMAKELGLPLSTLSTIVGQRDQIMQNVQRFGVNSKEAKSAHHVKVEEVLLTWFKEVTAAGVNVDGKVLREKAVDIALTLGVEDFQASGGWIHRFKARHNLSYKTVCGEGKKVDASAVEDWMATTLPSLIAGYEARNVFNIDEAGLFYNLQPEKSLCFKGEACQGGQKSKQRVTVLFCCNADGSEKMPLTVIGKYQKPRCFKAAGRLPCIYRANKKAWMTSALFVEFVTYLDRKMSCQNRKIVLLMDQCAAHPKQMTLQSVNVVFLPPNATSHLQPLDAGIIRNVKCHFKGLLVRRLLAKIDRKDANLLISILDAMHFVAVAWDRVTPATIANCFAKCGIFKSVVAATSQVPDPIPADVWNQLGVDCCADDFVTADDDLATCGLRTVEDIVEEASSQHGISSSDEDDDCRSDDQPPTVAETMRALDTLRRAVTSESVRESTSAQFFSFENALLADLAAKKTQKDIREFFVRK